ncbi:hypothetical protein BJX99DRAFT_190287 [Aspergillus californicus]
MCHTTYVTPFPRTASQLTIPEISKFLRGTFLSPFMRSYSPFLADAKISPEEFLGFIDGLNTVFIGHPVFQATGLVGGVLTIVPFHPVQLAGVGVQVISGLGTAAISYARTRAYIKAANQELFGPRGLRVKVITTKKMMAEVGVDDDRAQLLSASIPSPVPTKEVTERGIIQADQKIPLGKSGETAIPTTVYGSTSTSLDPRLQWMQALGDKVAPLQIDGLPGRVKPDNFLNRMSGSFAARQEIRQMKRLNRRQGKAHRRQEEYVGGAEWERQHGDERIRKIQSRIDEIQTKATENLYQNMYDPEKRVQIQMNLEDLGKQQQKLEQAVREHDMKVEETLGQGNATLTNVKAMEARLVQKIRWLVISKQIDETDSDSANDSD